MGIKNKKCIRGKKKPEPERGIHAASAFPRRQAGIISIRRQFHMEAA
jgi:hypothetical protein